MITGHTISAPLKKFFYICAGIWFGGGVCSYFFIDRDLGMFLVLCFIILAGFVGLVTTTKRILAFLNPSHHHIETHALDKDMLEHGSKLSKAFWREAFGRAEPQGKLSLSSKTEYASPVVLHRESSVSRPEKEQPVAPAIQTPLLTRIRGFLSGSIAQGKRSDLTRVILLPGLIGSTVVIIWFIAGSWEMFQASVTLILAVGIPLMLLSAFETGRKMLHVLLRVLVQVLDVIAGVVRYVLARRSSRLVRNDNFNGGGQALGKW